MELMIAGLLLALIAGYLGWAMMHRKPGEPLKRTLLRPLRGGGPGEERND